MALRTIVVERSGVCVVRVSGELDGAASAEFRNALVAVCATGRDRIAIDLSDVDYIESLAIGALIETHAAVLACGGQMGVACARSDIARILRLSGLGHVVPVFDTVDSAVAFLSATRR